MDRVHAATQERAAASLRSLGWLTAVELSFNHYGDRGRVDLLAYHAPTACLLVGEVKSAIGDVQETLGRIDVKVRLGRSLASSTGWPEVRGVLPALIVTESRTATARDRLAPNAVRAVLDEGPIGDGVAATSRLAAAIRVAVVRDPARYARQCAPGGQLRLAPDKSALPAAPGAQMARSVR